MRVAVFLSLLLAVPLPGRAEDPCGGLTLSDVAAASGIEFVHDRGATSWKHLPETMGSGAAWLDYDVDGWLDLYVVQSGPFPPDGSASAANRLYRNRADGSFEDVTARSGAGDRGYGQGVVAADVNGDAYPDLYVCNFGSDVLLVNQGDGTFRDGTAKAGLGLDGWSSSAAFADTDGDGDLDLYVTRYVEYDPQEKLFCGDPETGVREYCDPTLFRGASDRFYLNLGDGTFQDVTEDVGFANAVGKGLGVLLTDLDDDGRADVYVANDLTVNLLYRNAGDGTFESMSLLSGVALNREGKAEAGMGLAVGDVDGDQDADLVVSNFDVETNTLYENLGGMRFEDVSIKSGFGLPSFNLLGFGTVMADLDRDGDLDVYVANGHIYERPKRETVSYPQRDLLLLGDGRGRFVERACGPAFDVAEVGRGLAGADYDNDGDLDLAVVNSGGPFHMLRNDGAGGSWVGVVLRGKPPNTGAVGARVTLAGSAGRQLRWVVAGDSYQSSSDQRLLFGLPAGSTAIELEVRWPSGEVQTFGRVPIGRYLGISEAQTELELVAYDSRQPIADHPATARDRSLALRRGVVLALVAVATALSVFLFMRSRRSSR